MRRRSSALIAACLVLLAAGSVHGQARKVTSWDPGRKAQGRADPVTEHAAKLAEIDSWLRSLVGQYRLSIPGTTVEGMADCSGIGTGPGVHCIFSTGPPGQRDRWENAMMLFGIDTEGPGVNLFQLNRDSTAEMSVSRVRSSTVRIQPEPPDSQQSTASGRCCSTSRRPSTRSIQGTIGSSDRANACRQSNRKGFEIAS